jgi:hypothetical protein
MMNALFRPSLLRNVAILCCLLACFNLSYAQETPAAEQNQEQTPVPELGLFHAASNISIFIYRPGAAPCATQSAAQKLIPLGSGFVVQLEGKAAASAQPRNGWNFLVTAKHVIADQPEVIIRMSSRTASEFVCHSVKLKGAVFAAPGVDLVAVRLPEIPDADPTAVPSSLLIDVREMTDKNIGVGTDVLTVGYLLGYDGQKSSAPAAKSARLSTVTEQWWYHNPQSKRIEQAYALDLSSALELSGAPVFASGVATATYPFRYRELQPFVVGVVKGIILKPVEGELIDARVAVLEPGENLKTLMQQVANSLKDANIENPAMSENIPIPEIP